MPLSTCSRLCIQPGRVYLPEALSSAYSTSVIVCMDCGVMAVAVGNEHSDTSSNPR